MYPLSITVIDMSKKDTRANLKIQEDVAQDFRNLSRATNKDQSEMLRLLMTQGEFKETTTFSAKDRMLNRIEKGGE